MRARLPVVMAIASLAVAVAAVMGGCKDDSSSQRTPAAGAPSSATGAGSSAAGAGSSTAAAGSSALPTSSGSSAAPSSSAVAALTPEQEKGARSDIVNDCMACHTEEMLAQQRLTAKQWEKVVKKMQGWGSRLEGSSVETLVAYLSTRYGPTAPRFEPKVVDAAAAAEAIAQQPDGAFGKGDVKKGDALYKEACASCHGADGRGSAKGMNIADRPVLWRAADFAAVVRSGKGRMPAYPAYKDEDIAAAIAYLRTLKPQ